MAFEQVGVRLVVLGVRTFERDMKRADKAVTGFGKGIGSLKSPLSGIASGLNTVGTASVNLGRTLTTFVTLPLLAAGAAAITTGISFETAFTGVGKTVDGVMDNFGNLTETGEELRRGIRNLALTIPVAHDELAGVMQIAGQLGVRGTKNLLDFTETAAMLGVATDFSAEQAATGFAKLGNIVGVEAEDMGKFISNAGNAVVELGNNFAATEPEILNMSLRLAGVGQAVGLATPEILGISTAMVSMGIRAEMGGSAVSRIFLEMQSAVNSGGDELAAFADVLGMTETQFSSLFGSDPQRAFLELLSAFDDLNKEGNLTADILEDLNLDTIRTQDVLNRLAPNVDLVTKATSAANKEWTDQNALTNEFNKFSSTTSAELKILKNTLVDLGITIFDIVAPAFNRILGEIIDQVNNFNFLLTSSERFRKIVLKVAAALIILGPALTVVGKSLLFVSKIFSGLSLVFNAVSFVLLNPPLLIALAALAAGFFLITENVGGVGEAFSKLIEWVGWLTVSLRKNPIFTGALKAAFDSLLEGDLIGAFEHLKIAWSEFSNWFSNLFIPIIKGEWEKLKDLIMQKLIELAAGAVKLLIKANTKIREKLNEWKNAFVEWVSEAWSNLKNKLEELATNTTTWIGDRVDDIESKLTEWKNAFINWVDGVWDTLSNVNFAELIGFILGWITAKVILIAGQLALWTFAFYNWVNDVFPELVGKLAILLLQIIFWVVETSKKLDDKMLKEWIPALANWADGIWNGKEGQEGLKDKLDAMLDSFVNWIKHDAKDDIVSAISSLGQFVVDAAGDLGKGFFEGLLSGLGVDDPSLIEEAANLWKDIFTVEWAIGSPSKVAENLGSSFMAGLLLGFENDLQQVFDLADGVSGIFATQLSGKVASDAALGSSIVSNAVSTTSNTSSTFAPTINGVPMQSEETASKELVRAWRMAQVTGNVL